MLGLFHVAHRHLVTAPVVLALLAVNLRRTGPAFRGAEDDHRPGRALDDRALGSCLGPDLLDFLHRGVQHRQRCDPIRAILIGGAAPPALRLCQQ